MKKLILCVSAALTMFATANATTPNKIVVPDIEGYKTLKADLHIHTTFTDGVVWPVTRVQEAVWEGLDAIAITDHVDSRLQKNGKKGVFDAEKTDRNSSYKIAKKAAGKNLIVIHGGEISLGMPPGHFNCLFVKDNEAICAAAEQTDDLQANMMAGLAEAHAQGAWTMWNHPNWERQAPNETKWYKGHDQIYKAGYMQGIEIYNQFCGYSPEAHEWALKKNIAMTGNSDCHSPFFWIIDYMNGQHRPVTLIFAKERTEAGIREALEARRSAVLAENMVYGRESELRPLYEACVTVENVKVSDKQVSFKLVNNSCIPIRINRADGSGKYTYVHTYELRPFSEIVIKVYPNYVNNKRVKFDENTSSVDAKFLVETFQVGANKPLEYTYTFDIPKK